MGGYGQAYCISPAVTLRDKIKTNLTVVQWTKYYMVIGILFIV